MEHFDCCVTCRYFRRDTPPGTPVDAKQKMWCVKHERILNGDFQTKKSPICREYSPEEGEGSEWLYVIEKFPAGEIWSFELYLPSEKLVEIKNLKPVDPLSGNFVD